MLIQTPSGKGCKVTASDSKSNHEGPGRACVPGEGFGERAGLCGRGGGKGRADGKRREKPGPTKKKKKNLKTKQSNYGAISVEYTPYILNSYKPPLQEPNLNTINPKAEKTGRFRVPGMKLACKNVRVKGGGGDGDDKSKFPEKKKREDMIFVCVFFFWHRILEICMAIMKEISAKRKFQSLPP